MGLRIRFFNSLFLFFAFSQPLLAGLNPRIVSLPEGVIHPDCRTRLFYSEGNISLGDPENLCWKSLALGGQAIRLNLPPGSAPEAVRHIPMRFFSQKGDQWFLNLAAQIEDQSEAPKMSEGPLTNENLASRVAELKGAVERRKANQLLAPESAQLDLHRLIDSSAYAKLSDEKKIEQLRDYVKRGADLYRLNVYKDSVLIAATGDADFEQGPLWKGGRFTQTQSGLTIVKYLIEEAQADPNYVHTVRGSILSRALGVHTEPMRQYLKRVIVRPLGASDQDYAIKPDIQLVRYLLSLPNLDLPRDHLEDILRAIREEVFLVKIPSDIIRDIERRIQ